MLMMITMTITVMTTGNDLFRKLAKVVHKWTERGARRTDMYTCTTVSALTDYECRIRVCIQTKRIMSEESQQVLAEPASGSESLLLLLFLWRTGVRVMVVTVLVKGMTSGTVLVVAEKECAPDHSHEVTKVNLNSNFYHIFLSMKIK